MKANKGHHKRGDEPPVEPPRTEESLRTEEPPRAEDDEDRLLPGLPRYVRINTIKAGKKAVNKHLASAGYHHCPDHKHPGNRAFYHDGDVPDLLVFKPKGQSDVSRIPYTRSGELVIQQKASCFPAIALAPPPGATVIDACAAPGNKTSHLAAVMNNRGRVVAFEHNERRCNLLRRMMATKGASIVECVHGSFLDAAPDDPRYADVTHVLLDPSCSSSGMSRTSLNEPSALQELADTQVALVLHAMRFPAVRVVCYSTCSIHQIENESVVRRVLTSTQQRDFELAVAMPSWGRRGHLLPDGERTEAERIARCTVRSAYPEDGTIGFFLAKFVRGEEPTAGAELEAKMRSLEQSRSKRGKKRSRGS